MNIDNWLAWPTKSTDPGVNFAVLAVLAMLAVAALIVGAMFLVPLLIVLAVAKGVHWYVNRPAPTADIYAQTQLLSQQAHFPAPNDFLEAHLTRLINAWNGDYPVYNIYLKMADVAAKIYEAEGLANPVLPLPAAATSTIEEGRYRDALLARIRTMENAQRTLDCIHTAIGSAFITFTQHLPSIARTDRQSFTKAVNGEKPLCTVPLIDVLPNIGRVVRDLFSSFFSPEAEQLEIFSELRKQLELNIHEASGVAYPAPADKLVWPEKHKGTPHEVVRTYLHGTPFQNLFNAQIPFSFTDERRFEHMHVIGGSGHGKTQLLQHLILHDLQRAKPPALVIIDSQGEMLRKMQTLDFFAPGKRTLQPSRYHRSGGRGISTGAQYVRHEAPASRELPTNDQGADRGLDHRDIQLRVWCTRSGID